MMQCISETTKMILDTKSLLVYKTALIISRRCIQRFTPGLSNPLDDLVPYIQVPVILEKDWVFQPAKESIQSVQHLFKPTKSHPIVSLRGVGSFEELPRTGKPEVAVIGRSNVGKSSLIKSLFFNPLDTKISISKQPGHTNAMKVYQIGQKFALVDMPGFGFNMPHYFKESVEEYLVNRKELCRTFLLLDANAGLTDIDKIGIEMLEEFSKPYTVVFTKIDKCSYANMYNRIKQVMSFREDHMRACLPQPFLTSSTKDIGIGFLRAFIAHVTGNGGM